MAALASTVVTETGSPGMEVVTGVVTTDGDTYASRLGTIDHVIISDRTTANKVLATVTGQSIAVTATAGDTVDMIIIGKE